MNISLESLLILLVAVLVLTLDAKLWGKFDRVVNLILLERQEILKKIEGLLTRIEQLESKLKLLSGKDK